MHPHHHPIKAWAKKHARLAVELVSAAVLTSLVVWLLVRSVRLEARVQAAEASIEQVRDQARQVQELKSIAEMSADLKLIAARLNDIQKRLETP